MIIATSAAEARAHARQIQVNGKAYTLTEYVGAAPKHGRYVAGNEVNDNGLPQGFLVEQPPGSVTPPHFHEANQFQVFVGGSGSMGKHDAVPLTIQYANAHTPYGPIKAGEDGVRYFTLRQRWDPGAKYMPASREFLKKGNQRTRIVGGVPVSDAGQRESRASQSVETLIPPEDDGMAAFIFRVPRAARVDGLPDPHQCGGQYLMVAGGSLVHDGKTYEELSTVFISRDEAVPVLTAGPAGLDLLVLQFPVDLA